MHELNEKKRHNHISVVLVEPQGPLNIGSVCRTMMNFGFSDLRLVNPCCAYRGKEARRMAIKADWLMDQAEVYPDLAEALADCHVAMGTTRRFGKYREVFLSPDQASEMAALHAGPGRVALVFGREDKGLLTEELDLCQHFITIPTDEAFASMNLAQAVAVCLYEVNKALSNDGSSPVKPVELCQGQELEAMFQHMRKTLLHIDYSDPLNPDHILRTFRRMFGRAMLSERDVRALQGLWSRMDWVENQRRKLSEKV